MLGDAKSMQNSIEEKILKLGYDASSLDDLVHEIASAKASDANNEGVHGQVQFLKENGWDEKSILSWLES